VAIQSRANKAHSGRPPGHPMLAHDRGTSPPPIHARVRLLSDDAERAGHLTPHRSTRPRQYPDPGSAKTWFDGGDGVREGSAGPTRVQASLLFSGRRISERVWGPPPWASAEPIPTTRFRSTRRRRAQRRWVCLAAEATELRSCKLQPSVHRGPASFGRSDPRRSRHRPRPTGQRGRVVERDGRPK
jgi:hypothetical protein